tara:strand:+ start:194 stop:484 length:291 start_codon:yes stop_codon:yes gene_type:complete
MAIRAKEVKTIVNEVAKFKKDEIEFLFELIKNSMIPGQHLGIAMDIVNKLKSQYQLLNRKGAVVKTTKSTKDVVREEIEKVQQEIKEEDGELFIKE